MANNADAADRTMTGSTQVLPPTATRVAEFGEIDEVSAAIAGNRHLTDIAAADDEDETDEEAGASVEKTVPDGQDQAEQPGEAEDADGKPSAGAPGAARGIRLALVIGLATMLALGGLGGWFGYQVYRDHQADKQRSLFLAVGKQGALNLTTINYTEADADIQRILDSSTGQFYDDFSKRAPAFVEVVKQAEAKTDGKIVEAGLESVNNDSARVLVAVLVTTSNKGATDQQPRHWRMRIDVQKVGDTVKVANVGFVP